MKKIACIILLNFLFDYFICDEDKILSEILNSMNTDFMSRIDKTAQNINTETIQYALSYSDESTVKVYIKLVDDGIKNKINFWGFLRTESGKNEYELSCSNPTNDLIECFSQPDLILDTEDKYYLYYNRSRKEKIIFDYENIIDDDKRISLIFKPELYVNQTVYLDNKKIMAQINKKTVGEGYLYVINKSKKVLNNPPDRFNKYIELNNLVFNPSSKKTAKMDAKTAYEEAIRRGFHMVEAELQFTKDKIPIIYYKQNQISSKNLEELEKNEKILTLSNFLKISKLNKLIIELKFTYLDLKNNITLLDKYADIIIGEIKDKDMFNSVFFNDDLKLEIFSILIKKKKGLCVTVTNVNNKEEIEKIKDKYNETKRVIYNLEKDTVNKELVEYISSLGRGVKVYSVDDIKLLDQFQSWGVKYITTNTLDPFLINNIYDEPYMVKCVPIFLDDLSECKMGQDIILRDNEKYNIHYSLNIYNKSEDINETEIGEFRYEDTKINDNKYYIIKYIDFKRGLIQLITSDKVEKGKEIRGVIGPNYYNVAEAYQFNFVCPGINQNFIGCEIEKDPEKIEFDGEYVIYKLENYSYNEEEIEDFNLSKLKTKHLYSKQEKIIYSIFVIGISLVFLISSYNVQNKVNLKYFSDTKKLKTLPLKTIKREYNLFIDADGNKLIHD